MVLLGLSNMFSMTLWTLTLLLVAAVSANSNCHVPPVARNLAAYSTTNTSTHLTWVAPASVQCADHYRLSYCSYLKDPTQECAFKSVILPLNTTEYVVTGLQPCQYNLIELYTVAASGSNNYTYLVLRTGSGNPPKLNAAIVKYVSSDYITVTWGLPGGFTEQCYPGFRVCYSRKGDDIETCSDTIHQTFNTDVVSPLSPCSEYNVSVAVLDGRIAADSQTSARTYVSVVTAPQMSQLRAHVHNHTAQLKWATPNNLSMSCAASFSVTNCRFPMTLFATECNTVYTEALPLNATEASVGGLDSCASNYISVNLVGRNGYYTTSQLVILDQDSEIPAPTEAKVTDVMSNEFIVDYYKGSNDCVTSYRACWFTGREAETCKVTNSSWGASIKNIHLNPCSNYTLHFTALGRDDKLSKNATTNFLTGPATALNQSLKLSPHSALLSWKVAPSALHCGTNYNLTWYGLLSSAPDKHAVLPINTTSYNVTGLSACSEYRLIFSTKGTDGTTSGDSITEFTTSLGAVGPITGFRFQYISSDMVLMDTDWPDNSWECLDTYITCWYETGGSQEQEQCGERVTGWNVNTLLKACVNFTIVVTATTNDNRTISGSTTFTPGPVTVTNLTVDENATAHTVNLSWVNPPTNHLCAEYIRVTMTRVEDSKITQVKLANNATSTKLANLTPCTTYIIEVKPVASFIESGDEYLARFTTSCGDAAVNL